MGLEAIASCRHRMLIMQALRAADSFWVEYMAAVKGYEGGFSAGLAYFVGQSNFEQVFYQSGGTR